MGSALQSVAMKGTGVFCFLSTVLAFGGVGCFSPPVCPPCAPDACTKTITCPAYLIVKDDCDCCYECAGPPPPPLPTQGVLRGWCGGPGGRYGPCRPGLFCKEVPSVDLEIRGTCLHELSHFDICSETEDPRARPDSTCGAGLICQGSNPDAVVVEHGRCVFPSTRQPFTGHGRDVSNGVLPPGALH